ncbi:hypothetical protein [Methylococcus sp. EFPC2]|uniref:hypothetical protein n=1 Tax=Methylococcus sp. EFPC2 TaxID=2812648 RepID=UPI001968220F|nr:hypothetical protein [Methylococcus sp. EFPC2]QSA97259.1 hypothetical protein JWZ97_19090 [Methylococcus sp. EFPC2]
MYSLATIAAVAATIGFGALSLRIPPLSLLSAAALGLTALRLDLRPSAGVLAASLIGIGLIGMAIGGEWGAVVFYGLVLWMPIWLAGRLLRFSANLTLTLEATTAAVILAVGVFYLVTDEPAQYWQKTTEQVVRPMLEHAPPGIDQAQMKQGLEVVSHYLSGISAAGALFGLILELLLARALQAVWFNPGGFRREFIALRLHRPAAYAGLATVAAGLAAGGSIAELAWNLAIPLSVLCLFAGLAVVHALAAKSGTGGFWLAGVYVMLFVSLAVAPRLSALAILLTSLLGLSDPWLDWRHRFGGQTPR